MPTSAETSENPDSCVPRNVLGLITMPSARAAMSISTHTASYGAESSFLIEERPAWKGCALREYTREGSHFCAWSRKCGWSDKNR
eukprot:CAMPEP_0196729138 /NCGR_PEP_ID=MMETSP1091-20130531/9612_1 /TAXON_ID=302021 /ORGANISM="Rhodomonas sp., Strain CCMP768" /LENGTH=84 /DNA_ID=CAMNT_0042071985 /DNA_START=139 /DNA_END=393 /DNA_ORIENTATION=+